MVYSHTDTKTVHMLGIGGAGMAALAHMMRDMGYRVTGSDCAASDNTKRLAAQGIPVFMTDDITPLETADLCVYSAAIPEESPLLQYAKKHIPTFSRGEMMGQLSRSFHTVAAVAGTHGKTTVSALLTHILLLDGKNPSALIGGYYESLGGNGRLGGRDLLVCEACEFAGSFSYLKRDLGILLNIDNDHLECYGSMERLEKAFTKFTEQCDTCLVYAGDSAAMAATDSHPNRICFGLEPNLSYRGENLTQDKGFYTFTLMVQNESYGSVSLKIPGKHNVLNALAAAGAAHMLGASKQAILCSLRSFTGVSRRFEVLFHSDTLTIADDYAHHPAEIQSVLDSAAAMGFSRITAVFQPFTYSRTAALQKEFAAVLSKASRVILAPVMGGREPDDGSVSSFDIAKHMENAVVCEDLESCAAAALANRQPGELIVTMGCGNVYYCARQMTAMLQPE